MAILRRPDKPGKRSPDTWEQLAKGRLNVWKAIFGDGRGIILNIGKYDLLIAQNELPLLYATVKEMLDEIGQ